MIALLPRSWVESMSQPILFITSSWLYARIPVKGFVLETVGGTLARLAKMELPIKKTKVVDKRVHMWARYTIKSWQMYYER